jgi:ATP-binding cassette subfamily B protein
LGTHRGERRLVDELEIDSVVWQANIAQVPQSIFLADSSVAENIALRIPAAEIDRPRLEAPAA